MIWSWIPKLLLFIIGFPIRPTAPAWGAPYISSVLRQARICNQHVWWWKTNNIWNHLLCQLRAIAISESHQPLNAPILSPPRHGGSGWNRRPRCTQSWPIYWDWTHSSNQRWELEFFDLIPEAASTILVLSIIYPSFIHLIHHLDLLKDLKATGSL